MTLFNTFMARITDWNNVHSVFFVVTVMMVIMLRLFSTYYARQGRSGRNLSAVKHKITGKIDFTIRSDCLTQPLVYSNYNIGGIKYA